MSCTSGQTQQIGRSGETRAGLFVFLKSIPRRQVESEPAQERGLYPLVPGVQGYVKYLHDQAARGSVVRPAAAGTPLKNARHEAFCRHFVGGMSAVAADQAAGFKRDKGNASVVANKPTVVARVAELRAAAAGLAEVTASDIAAQLDEDRTFARSLENPGAAVSATMGKAKVLGLIVEKNEHAGKDGVPISFTITTNDGGAEGR